MEKTKVTHKRFDLIIKFNCDSYVDIRNNPHFQKIGNWTKYGKSGFRSFSLLNKEEMKRYILEHLDISCDKFEVFSANVGLYIPH